MYRHKDTGLTFLRMSKASGARAWGGLVRMDDCIRSNVPNESIRSAHTLVHLCSEAPLRRKDQVVYGHGGSQRESCRYFLFTSSGLAVSVKSKISYGLRIPSVYQFTPSAICIRRRGIVPAERDRRRTSA